MTTKHIILILIFPLTFFGQTRSYIDSLDKANQKHVEQSGRNITKLHISKQDSSINLKANIRVDHRLFGYSQPNKNSKRLILISVFTNDVEKNPFGCDLGAYYETSDIKDVKLKYQATIKDFVKVKAVDKRNITTDLYFEKKWTLFD